MLFFFLSLNLVSFARFNTLLQQQQTTKASVDTKLIWLENRFNKVFHLMENFGDYYSSDVLLSFVLAHDNTFTFKNQRVDVLIECLHFFICFCCCCCCYFAILSMLMSLYYRRVIYTRINYLHSIEFKLLYLIEGVNSAIFHRCHM